MAEVSYRGQCAKCLPSPESSLGRAGIEASSVLRSNTIALQVRQWVDWIDEVVAVRYPCGPRSGYASCVDRLCYRPAQSAWGGMSWLRLLSAIPTGKPSPGRR